jgi:mono/diheme cytochrome c family protein
MAATDKTYRDQKALDIVFAVSCVLMLLSIIWMFAQDYYRDFKQVQRTFRDVEAAMTERAMLDKLPDVAKAQQAASAVDEARAEVESAKKNVPSEVKTLDRNKAKAEAEYQGTKANLDSNASLYNIAVEQRDEVEATSPRYAALQAAVDRRKKEVERLTAELVASQNKLDQIDKDITAKRAAQRAAEEKLSKAEDNLKKVSGEFERFAKTTAQKEWTVYDWVRKLPVLDAFASPVKIQQYTLTEYPIDYSFKYVTRFDRCTTCHLGIDRPNYTKEALTRLTPEHFPPELQDKLKQARELLAKRADSDSTLGFKVSDLPDKVQTIDLTEAQKNEYCAHPRLDLFVDPNSPHPAEKFGCTSCHSGQGSATDFNLAAHVPNDSEQRQTWTREHGWTTNHYWDYPMLAKRFVESTCLKCHHQVSDLVRYGSKQEAPKLLRGYNLVRESGCFGCHEISGFKGGREVGPDLRLEPSPPLEDYTPAERVKLLADPLNPPGQMRKVGPSLYRITEKTNPSWTRKWIAAPRDFRTSTKMPHFYGLSNNRDDVLPSDQQGFPAAEVASITHYLFRESQDYLKGEDKYRKANEARIQELKQKKEVNLASEQELKVLEELTRRLEMDKKPTPLRDDNVIDGDGRTVELPPAGQDDPKEGRKLFTERGCLACHMNQGTTKSEDGVPTVSSDADFGPDLSRLAAKIAPEGNDAGARRRWLIQWILNPKRHHPRTRMPITFLTPKQAADVAAWLLQQQVGDWQQADVPDPKPEVLQELAKVYMLKAPGMTRAEVEKMLGSRQGLEDVSQLPLDSDERVLSGQLTDDKLKWYIGRKAITRLGCFGCHQIPGFDTAKPIGTPLNDWGKKDPERLAFEDIIAYAKEHYQPVDRMTDDKGYGRVAEKGQKQPYEGFFLEALEHHQRDGFLHQKLSEPRSYDYNRLRTWDDRLRMPQFQFARGRIKPLEGETMEQAKAREEAEAREAVMTFVLGLVAEPVPASYMNAPPPDRLAEVKGRKVLEKYNCIGCHQVRPGVYEIIRTDEDSEASRDLASRLDERYKQAMNSTQGKGDHPFPEHNAWTGLPSPLADRLLAYGLPSPPPSSDIDHYVRLTQALRYSKGGKDQPKEVNNIPAAEFVDLKGKDLIAHSTPFGGEFADLMVRSRYLTQIDPQNFATQANGESPASRSAWPPPLLREGEKTQPGWLFQFLRNPTIIRPLVRLRMPRFNMSEEEAMDLVNYFSAVDRMNNPGIGLPYPYLPPFPQRDESFWQLQSQGYTAKLRGANLLEGRLEKLKPLWNTLFGSPAHAEQVAQAEAAVQKAKEIEAKEADPAKKKLAEGARRRAEQQLAELKDKAAYEKTARAEWETRQSYANDAYRLLASYDRCLNCHVVGPQLPTQPIGPALELAAARLRSDYTQRWIASPQRLLVYPDGAHPMPTNFAKDVPPYPDFAGTMLEQATAVRDVLIDYPKVAELPVNRNYRSAPGENK